MMRNTRRKNFSLLLIVVVIFGLAGSTGYFFMENRDLKNQLSMTEQERNEIKNDKLISEIEKVFDLPEEEPTIVFVNDAEKAKSENPGLSEQFGDIQKGDYILIFRDARLGVHYRPSDKKVIKSTTVQLPIIVELVGTQADVDAVAEKLAEFGNQITVTKTVKDGITQSFVFDVKDNQKAEAESIAKQLGYEVGTTLPATITPVKLTEIVISVSSSLPDTTSTQEP